jgi:hypothetical protein
MRVVRRFPGAACGERSREERYLQGGTERSGYQGVDRRRALSGRYDQGAVGDNPNRHHVSSYRPAHIGPGAGLDGELLIVETLVTDVSTKTDKMQVIVTLEGGPRPKTVKADGEVGSAGDSILFRTFVAFRE